MSRTRIFISSVQKELAGERRAIRDFIAGDPLLRRFFDVIRFEDLPAADRRADQVYLQQVDRCGIYVGIFGNEYGVETRGGLSPTEREFDRATERAKTRLIFVKGLDDRNRHPRMAALIRKAGTQLIRRRFLGAADLTVALYASLVEYLEQSGGLRTKPFDAAACPDAKLGDLSRAKLAEFLARARAERGYALGPKTPMNKALTHLNLLDGGKPTYAAVLLFGKQPQRFLLTSEVKCMHFHGLAVGKPIPSYHIYKGTVFELVDQAVDFVMAKLNRAVIPRDGKVTSDVEYELPWKAVREAIVNAVTHRDYASNASVQVMLFADRLEVWNPGELPPPLTPAALRKPHPSIPRNPLIAEPMFLATYAEKAGSGILDMVQLCRRAGLREPAFRQDGGQFVQTIWRPKAAAIAARPEQVPDKYPTSTRQVLGALGPKNAEFSRARLQKAAGFRNREHFVQEHLNPLLTAGLIEMTIPDKPRSRRQQYRLTEKGRAWLERKKS